MKLSDAMKLFEESAHQVNLAINRCGAGELREIISAQIASIQHRQSALWICLVRRDELLKRDLFRDIVLQCDVGHSDVDIARLVVLSMSRPWVISNIESVIVSDLKEPPLLDDERYLRYGELLVLLDRELALRHVERCRATNTPELLDVASILDDLLLRASETDGAVEVNRF